MAQSWMNTRRGQAEISEQPNPVESPDDPKVVDEKPVDSKESSGTLPHGNPSPSVNFEGYRDGQIYVGCKIEVIEPTNEYFGKHGVVTLIVANGRMLADIEAVPGIFTKGVLLFLAWVRSLMAVLIPAESEGCDATEPEDEEEDDDGGSTVKPQGLPTPPPLESGKTNSEAWEEEDDDGGGSLNPQGLSTPPPPESGGINSEAWLLDSEEASRRAKSFKYIVGDRVSVSDKTHKYCGCRGTVTQVDFENAQSYQVQNEDYARE